MLKRAHKRWCNAWARNHPQRRFPRLLGVTESGVQDRQPAWPGRESSAAHISPLVWSRERTRTEPTQCPPTPLDRDPSVETTFPSAPRSQAWPRDQAPAKRMPGLPFRLPPWVSPRPRAQTATRPACNPGRLGKGEINGFFQPLCFGVCEIDLIHQKLIFKALASKIKSSQSIYCSSK